MNQQLEKQTYAGVLCRSCRQPIPIPAIVITMASEVESGKSPREVPRGCVFSVRCRACDKEMPYSASEIMEFEGTPRPRVSPARRRSEFPEGLSRAASA
jgi:hypothetical protein